MGTTRFRSLGGRDKVWEKSSGCFSSMVGTLAIMERRLERWYSSEIWGQLPA